MNEQQLRLECLHMAAQKYSGDQLIRMADLMYQYVMTGKK